MQDSKTGSEYQSKLVAWLSEEIAMFGVTDFKMLKYDKNDPVLGDVFQFVVVAWGKAANTQIPPGYYVVTFGSRKRNLEPVLAEHAANLRRVYGGGKLTEEKGIVTTSFLIEQSIHTCAERFRLLMVLAKLGFRPESEVLGTDSGDASAKERMLAMINAPL